MKKLEEGSPSSDGATRRERMLLKVTSALVFAPGFFLILLGFSLFTLPEAVTSVLSMLLVSTGVIIVRGTAILTRLYRKFEESLRGSEGRMMIQGVIVRGNQTEQEPTPIQPEGEAKKDWLH